MYVIFDTINKKVLKLVRHKPDLTMAVGHGSGPIFAVPEIHQAQQVISGHEVWIGDVMYVLEVSFFDRIQDKKTINKTLKPIKLTIDSNQNPTKGGSIDHIL